MNSTPKSKYNIIKSIVILSGIAMLLSCENSMKEVQSLTTNQNLPVQQGKEVEFIYTDSTKIQYRAFAVEFVETNSEEEGMLREFPKGGKIISYDEDEKTAWEIKANYAKHYPKDELWELRNDVQATRADGTKINSELMFWDHKKKLIYSDQYTRIITEDGQVLEGTNFSADEDMNEFRLKNVSGEVYLEDKNKQ
ncbi:LPS export ABC transporter periplasmic protein LptC [Marinifilum caeruleilacunae]|uniref:LPS export ABC transporter periplasmic protein LptC n=1 Tax=Marinifilum caeruleilacunae TaxID=2499076 RepID=A0ABX1WW31_9BACT|nr:LPS export ABC transporter periplasmic protein LptC [Marinifilum caeruleilacunae]NOU60098.1 LPS export ABC transporter periplasmic protein LptC [Marinifilum caeruleilacunae]